MVDVRNEYQRFEQAGGEVAVVTQGTPRQAARFRRQKRLPFACLSDADRSAYRAFHIARATVGQMAAPSVMAAGAKAILRGGIGVPQSDLKQLGGSFVIDRQGVIRFAYYSTTIADNPSNDQLIAALTADT